MRRPSMVSLLLRVMLAGPACLLLAGCAGSPESALTGLLTEPGDPSPELTSRTAPADSADDRTPALAFADGGSLLDQARRIAAAKGLGRPPADAPTSDDAGPPANSPVLAPPAQRVAEVGARPAAALEGIDVAEANARIREAAERLRAARASAHALRGEPPSGPADDPREMFRRAVELARAQSLKEQRRAFGGLAELAPAVAEPPTPSYFTQAIRMRQADAGVLKPLGPPR